MESTDGRNLRHHAQPAQHVHSTPLRCGHFRPRTNGQFAAFAATGLKLDHVNAHKHVHVHPKILDGFGQTMSKSKGNGVDPLDLMEHYGADGMRFGLMLP